MPSSNPPQYDKNFADFQSPNEASVERLVHALDRIYHRPFLFMWRSFLGGLMTAVGATVGTLLMFIVLGYVFQVLGGYGLLQPYVEKFQRSLIQSQARQVEGILNQSSTPLPNP